MIKFDNTYAQLPSSFFDVIENSSPFTPKLIAFNQDLSRELGLDREGISDETLARYFSGKEFPPGANPVAMVYAGHQFGHFVPQLGDGRALLLGEFMGSSGKRYDIHLKGSGRTKYSRRGDGKSAIGPVIREYLVSEGMYALSIPTTRSLCAVRSGETVFRDQLLPGAVLTRIALSHIRVGTFEYFARKGDFENLKVLADYTISRLYSGRSYFEFWQEVAHKQIELILAWMSVGFIHGVMNTDNMSVSGETIDFGPCAFMDNFSYTRVFSSIDQYGRYAYSNQPQIALWNLTRLAECLLPIMDNKEEAERAFISEIDRFKESLPLRLIKKMSLKFGLKKHFPEDEELILRWFEFMEKSDLDFTLSYIDLERFIEGKKTFTGLEKIEGFDALVEKLRLRLIQEERTFLDAAREMTQINPLTVPRNHLIERAIRESEQGRDEEFFKLLGVLKNPFERLEELTSYQLAPKEVERVTRTFCGT